MSGPLAERLKRCIDKPHSPLYHEAFVLGRSQRRMVRHPSWPHSSPPLATHLPIGFFCSQFLEEALLLHTCKARRRLDSPRLCLSTLHRSQQMEQKMKRPTVNLYLNDRRTDVLLRPFVLKVWPVHKKNQILS